MQFYRAPTEPRLDLTSMDSKVDMPVSLLIALDPFESPP